MNTVLPAIVLYGIFDNITDVYDRIAFGFTCKSTYNYLLNRKLKSKTFYSLDIKFIADLLSGKLKYRKMGSGRLFFGNSVHLSIINNTYLEELPKIEPLVIESFNRTLVNLSIIIDCDSIFPLIRQSSVLENLSITLKSFVEIEKGWIPGTVKYLVVVSCLSKSIPLDLCGVLCAGSIPESVERLVLDHSIILEDSLGILPSSVTEFDIKNIKFNVNECWDMNMIPPSVKILSLFGEFLNRLEPGFLPSTITDLSIDDKISCNFISPGLIPSSVRRLSISGCSTRFLPGSIPASVEELSLSRLVQTIKPGLIPFGVKSLEIYHDYIGDVKSTLPQSLTKLVFPGIDLDDPSKELPNSLLHLEIQISFSPNIVFPSHLQYLRVKLDIIRKKTKLPQTLKTLILDTEIKEIEMGSLPESLSKIVFNSQVNIHLPKGTLPSTCLTDLSFLGKVSYMPYIPKTVTNLILKGKCETSRSLFKSEYSIPQSVESLELCFEFGFSHLSKKEFLPSNLKNLTNRIFIPSSNTPFYIPDSIENLVFSNLSEIPDANLIHQFFSQQQPNPWDNVFGDLKLKIDQKSVFYKKKLSFTLNSNSGEFEDDEDSYIEEEEDEEYGDDDDENNSENGYRKREKLPKQIRPISELQLLGSLSKFEFTIQTIDDLEVLNYIRESTILEDLGIDIELPPSPSIFRIPKGIIPSSVRTLKINANQFHDMISSPSQFRAILEKGTVPGTVTKLMIHHLIFKDNIEVIPDELEELGVIEWENSPMDKSTHPLFPPNIKTLEFFTSVSNYFTVGSFPFSLTELRMWMKIEYPLSPGVLPNSIRKLVLGHCSHPLVPGSLPQSLEILQMVYFRDQLTIISEPGIFPEGLQDRVSQRFNCKVLPSSLLSLDISMVPNSEVYPLTSIPKTIQYLSITVLKENSHDIDQCSLLISHLFNEFPSIREIHLTLDNGMVDLITQKIKFLSLDPTDPFIYYSINDNVGEGFLNRKSNFKEFLDILGE
eukprot:gene4311-5396_t